MRRPAFHVEPRPVSHVVEEDTMTDRDFVSQNAHQRTRLKSLVARLSDTDLARPLEAGWTVAAVLAHVAFWDQRALILLERWQKAGVAAVPHGVNEADVDWINDAGKPLFLAMAPRRAAETAVAIAEAVDRAIESLPDEFVTRNAAAGTPVSLLRAEHRRQHLDEIETASGR
jgi:mycothiol maleylpyruvate isomerase-like protein